MKDAAFMRNALWNVLWVYVFLAGCSNGDGASLVCHDLPLDSLSEMAIDGERSYCEVRFQKC